MIFGKCESPDESVGVFGIGELGNGIVGSKIDNGCEKGRGTEKETGTDCIVTTVLNNELEIALESKTFSTDITPPSLVTCATETLSPPPSVTGTSNKSSQETFKKLGALSSVSSPIALFKMDTNFSGGSTR